MSERRPIATRTSLQDTLPRLGRWLLVTAVASLAVRRNDFYWPLRRLFELLVVSSLSVTLLWLWMIDGWRQALGAAQRVRLPFLLIGGGLIAATVTGALFLNIPFDKEGVLNFGRAALVMVMVTLILVHSQWDAALPQKLQWSFFINFAYIPLLIPLLWIKAPFLDHWQLVIGRFQGLENYPSNAGYLFLILLAFTFYRFTQSFRTPPGWTRTAGLLLFWILAVLAMSFIWWSGSRASWIAAVVILTIIIWKQSRHRGAAIISHTAAAAAVILIGHLLLSPVAKITAANRLWTINTDNGMGLSGEPAQQNGKPASLSLIRDQRPRLYAWLYYLSYLPRHPLGMGVSYYYSSQTAVFEGKPIAPHNTVMEVLVMGGAAALIGYLALWLEAFRFAAGRPDVQAALTGLLMASFFDNMIVFKAWWVIIGIAFAIGQTRQRHLQNQSRMPNFRKTGSSVG